MGHCVNYRESRSFVLSGSCGWSRQQATVPVEVVSEAEPNTDSSPIRAPTPVGLVTGNFLALGAGEVIARVVAFLATVYVARVLGAPYFGMVAFSAAVLLYLGRFVDGGLDLGLGIQLIASKRSRVERLGGMLLSTRLTVATLLSLLLAAVGILAFRKPEGYVLATYGLLLFPIALSSRWIHLGLERARHVSVARVAGELVMLSLMLTFVRSPNDVLGVPLAQFTGDALAAAVLIGWLFRWGYRTRFSVRWRVLRPVVRRATPLVSASLLGLLIFNSDLLLLRVFRGTAAVGLYVAAYALISFLGNLMSTYGAALLPTLARLQGHRNEQLSLYHTATAHVFAVALPITVGGILLAPQIIRLVFGEGYEAAALPLQILLCSTTLGVVREVARVGLLASGREDRILAMNAWGTGFNVSANLVAIPIFGMVGAASTTVATEVLRLFFAQRFAAREGFTPVGPRRFWRPVVAVAFMVVLLSVLKGSQLWLTIPAGAAVYTAALVATGGLRIRWGELPRLDM